MNSNVAPAPQLTARAIILAVILAMFLAAANTYLGLFAGMTIASAIPAAVVSMAVLRALGGGGILENNIVQTGASAGTSIASGVIFTVPALVIMGYWTDFKYWWVLAIAGLGRLARRVVFGASAPVIDRRPADGFPRGQGRGGSAARRREPFAGRQDSRAVGAGGRSRQAHRRERPAPHSRQRAAPAASSASTSATSAPTFRPRC